MATEERDLEYYLLIHDYAIPAWLCWFVLTVVVMAYTTLSGPFIAEVPHIEIAVVPLVMIGWWWVWMGAGMMVGWVPPRF